MVNEGLGAMLDVCDTLLGLVVWLVPERDRERWPRVFFFLFWCRYRKKNANNIRISPQRLSQGVIGQILRVVGFGVVA